MDPTTVLLEMAIAVLLMNVLEKLIHVELGYLITLQEFFSILQVVFMTFCDLCRPPFCVNFIHWLLKALLQFLLK